MNQEREIERISDVKLDAGLAQSIIEYLHGAQMLERGGILIGRRDDEGVTIGGAVFPPQMARAGNHCAFDVNGIDITRQALTALTDPDIRQIGGTIIGWVHSHPGHGLYLSEIDVRTLSDWVQLDEKAIAVVVDPFLKRPPTEQIAWWQRESRGRPVRFGQLGSDAMTVQQAASLAEAVTDSAGGGRRWDVLAPGCIISIFPRPRGAGPPAESAGSTETPASAGPDESGSRG